MSHTIPANRRRNPMRLYEENYRLLQKLLPGAAAGDRVSLIDEEASCDVDLVVIETAKYTTTLALTKYFGSGDDLLPDLRMQVRIYHDARVAEVLAYQECSRVPPRYAADGLRYNRDEKRQVNALLHELLRYCQRKGYQGLAERGCPSL